MARVKFSAIISRVSGSVGQGCFQAYKGGNTLRNKPLPIKSPTEFQTLSRTYVRQVQIAWAALSENEQKQWNSFLSFVPAFQKKEQTVLLSGYQLFLKYNLIRLHAGFDILSTFNYSSLDDNTLSFDLGIDSGQLAIKFDEGFDSDYNNFLVKISPPFTTPSIAKQNRLRVIDHVHYFSGDYKNYVLKTGYERVFGTQPSVGQFVLVSITYFSTVNPIFYKERFYPFTEIIAF